MEISKNHLIRIFLCNGRLRVKLLFRSDSEDPVSYPFIDNFCGDPDELNVYESLIIHSNGQSKNGQYSIEAFSFNGNENGEIYLHCTVSLKKLFFGSFLSKKNCLAIFLNFSSKLMAQKLSEGQFWLIPKNFECSQFFDLLAEILYSEKFRVQFSFYIS